jgi:hypothetical protein
MACIFCVVHTMPSAAISLRALTSVLVMMLCVGSRDNRAVPIMLLALAAEQPHPGHAPRQAARSRLVSGHKIGPTGAICPVIDCVLQCNTCPCFVEITALVWLYCLYRFLLFARYIRALIGEESSYDSAPHSRAISRETAKCRLHWSRGKRARQTREPLLRQLHMQ